ncbi:MAG: hypoxanthine phosphoribosyltransferase [Proteobacteria bacterium]|nr:MAG: hypoxanthine phosphoribosyltransferase [Pseudomonadota bacterium]
MPELKMRTLFSSAQLAERVTALGAEITRDYKGRKVILVGVLKGSFIFLSDLVRAIDLDCEIEFIGVSSYEGMHSTGQVRIQNDLSKDVEGENIILVEDIIDTGTTIDYLKKIFEVRRPKSLSVACLLSKPEAHKVPLTIEYTGFEITKEFVVGYGLDYNGLYRNLPNLMQVID